MIPEALRKLSEQQPGEVRRTDAEAALSALRSLGVSPQSELAEFFLNYKVTNFSSRNSDETLLDVASPTRQIEEASQFCWEVWEIPRHYLCLTSPEGEGAYLYNLEDEGIYDFSLSASENLLSGKEPKMFGSFFEFMHWYLDDAVN